jgi:hypothetical protein
VVGVVDVGDVADVSDAVAAEAAPSGPGDPDVVGVAAALAGVAATATVGSSSPPEIQPFSKGAQNHSATTATMPNTAAFLGFAVASLRNCRMNFFTVTAFTADHDAPSDALARLLPYIGQLDCFT